MKSVKSIKSPSLLSQISCFLFSQLPKFSTDETRLANFRLRKGGVLPQKSVEAIGLWLHQMEYLGSGYSWWLIVFYEKKMVINGY